MAERTYSVYVHKTPDDRYYVGVTSNLRERWSPTRYRKTALMDAINSQGWDNIEHIVAYETEGKEKALAVEDMLITMYHSIGRNINRHRSGLVWKRDPVAYERKKKHNNNDYWNKQRESNKLSKRRALAKPEGKIYNRVKAFNNDHPDRVVETALEAKNKYIQTGYIPTYIKHDDL